LRYFSINLRLATNSQNNANTRARSASGYKGVYAHHQEGQTRYVAEIACEERKHYLGIYATADDAAHAYDMKARELFGEFAQLNFPHESVAPARSVARVDSKSGYRGVSQRKSDGRWVAELKHEGKRYRMFSFATAEAAARAYDAKKREVIGDKARCNF